MSENFPLDTVRFARVCSGTAYGEEARECYEEVVELARQFDELRKLLLRGRRFISSGSGHREEIMAWLCDVDDLLDPNVKEEVDG